MNCVFLHKKAMTRIIRTENINGGEVSKEVVNRLSTQTISPAPQVVREYFSNRWTEFDPYDSVVLFDYETNYIYGYILAHVLDIPNIDVVYNGQEQIIDYLKNGFGLFVSDVVLRNEIKGTPLIKLLNCLHFAFCQADVKKDKCYVWMDLGEIIWSPTKQNEGFSIYSLNNISRTFYDKCL